MATSSLAPFALRGAALALSLSAGLLAAGCTEYYTLDLPDENFEQPDDLPRRLSAFRSGAETWHGDPKRVADLALRNSIKCNVPWAPEPYRPSQYEIKETPEWGTFVVRGYIYPSGNLMRYRVKIRAYKEIWYAIQISHYKMYDVDEDEVHPLAPK